MSTEIMRMVAKQGVFVLLKQLFCDGEADVKHKK
jgi:hypothetical protein